MEYQYGLDLTETSSSIINVSLSFEATFDNPVLEMPNWTPGSYLIRDYSRHVQNLNASINGNDTSSYKVEKNKWKIEADKGSLIKIDYSIYAYELTVRTSYLDDKKVMISPASIFFYETDGSNVKLKDNKFRISFSLPKNWSIYTSLKNDNNQFVANDFDELVDSPMCGGLDEVLEISDYNYNDGLKDVPCKIVIIGDKGDTDMPKFQEALIKIQDYSVKLFGDLPYDRYFWFLFVVGQGGGGLEHKFSNVSIINRWFFTKKDNFNRLMALESHEHFHTYNIKRIRPSQLGPFNYDTEVYTKLLWVAEGLTSFYDKISLVRGGIAERKDYFEMIGKLVYNLENVPGRKNYSLSESSFDAWIKLYKSNENTNNSAVSYYLKGSIVGICLDLEIRNQTNWEKSLDDFFHAMYLEYKKNKIEGYPEDKLQELVENHTGTKLEEFWNKYINGTDEIPYNHYLNMIGYEIKEEMKDKVFTGINFKNQSKVISFIHKDSPAYRAGIFVNDEIIGINGYKATSTYESVLERSKPGELIDLLVYRDDKILERKVKLDNPKPSEIKIEPLENVEEFEGKLDKFFS